MAFSSFTGRGAAMRLSARPLFFLLAAAAAALAAASIQPASAHDPDSFAWSGVTALPAPTLSLAALDAAGNARTGTALRYDNGASARNRVQFKITHSCVRNTLHFNWLLCPVRGTRSSHHFGAITFYAFEGASGRAASDAVSGAKGYRPASGGGWNDCTSGASDICVISATTHYREYGPRVGETVVITFEVGFSIPSSTTGAIRIAAKHRHVHASSDAWAELSYASAEPDPAVELKPYTAAGALETGDASSASRNYSTGSTPNKVRIRIMASATEPLQSSDFNLFSGVRIGVFAGASGRAASDAVSGAGIKTADGANPWHGCQSESSAHWPCTMTPLLYSVAHIENYLLRRTAMALLGFGASGQNGVDFSFTLPAGTTGEVRLFAQFTDSSLAGSGWAELSYDEPPAPQPTAPVVQPVQPEPEPAEPPTAKLVPYTSAGALETGDLSTNTRDYVPGTGRQRVQLSVVDSDGAAAAYSTFDSIKLSVFSGDSGRAGSDYVVGSAAYAVGGGQWNACAGRGDHDICVINRANYKSAAGASADGADIAAIEFTFSVPSGTTGGIRLAAALAPSQSGAATQWTELAYRQQPPADPQPQPVTSSPAPVAKITPYTAAGTLETGDVSTNTRSYVKGGSALNKVRLSVGPSSGDGAVAYRDINSAYVYVFGAGSGRDAADAVSGAGVRSSAGAAWSTCDAYASGHAICVIERGAWKTAAGASSSSEEVAALDFSFTLTSATTGGVRLAIAFYVPGSSTPSWTEVAYGAPQAPADPAPQPQPQPVTPSPTPAAKLTPYTAAGVLEADGTTSRTYATGSTRNKVRLSIGPSSGSGTISYANIDKAAVYLFGAGSGRAVGDALATGSIWGSDGRAWSTCALPSTGHANCEISRAAWKTAAGASSDDAAVASLDFSFKLTSATSGAVRLAVALYAGGSSTPSWTEVAYDAASVQAPQQPAPASPSPSPTPTPAAKITPYTAAGALETGDISTNTRSYAKGASALNKVRLSVGPAGGSGTISYADIDKAAVHVFGAGSGRDAADAVSGASVRSSTGAAWSTCAAVSSGHAICEISRAAWKTAAGGSSDADAVGALDFGFRLTGATSGSVRLAVALYAGGNGTPSWTEAAYGAPVEPVIIVQPPNPRVTIDPVPELPVEALPAVELTPYTAAGALETGDAATNFRRYVRGGTTLNKVRLGIVPLGGSGDIAYADIDKVAVHVFTAGSGRAAADAFSGAQVRSATGTAWSACSAPSAGHAICEISRAAWKTAAGDSSDSDSVDALDFGFRLPAAAAGIARLAVQLTAKNGAVLQWVELRYSEPGAAAPEGPTAPVTPTPFEEPDPPVDPPAEEREEEEDHPTGPVCIGACDEQPEDEPVRVVSARLVRADGRSGPVMAGSNVPLRLVLSGPDGRAVPVHAVRALKIVMLQGGGEATFSDCPPGVSCTPGPPARQAAQQAVGGQSGEPRPRVALAISGDAPVAPVMLNFRAPRQTGQSEICAVVINAAGGKPLLAEVIIDYISPLPAVRLALGEPGRYLHRHATAHDDSDELVFTSAAFDLNGDRAEMPHPTAVAVTGPEGGEIGIDRIAIAEACGFAGGSACKYRLSATAPAGNPLQIGRYRLHLRAGALAAAVDFHVTGPADRIVLERAHPGAYGERFAVRARVYDRFGEPVADGTPVWISAVVRDQGLNDAATSAGPVEPRRAITLGGTAVTGWAVLGRELAIVSALAGGEREQPHASTTAVIDTGLRGDCSARSLSSHQRAAYSFWFGGPGCRASDLDDVLLDLTGGIWLWNGVAWLRYAEQAGRMVPGSIDFDLRNGDLLWLGDLPPNGAVA